MPRTGLQQNTPTAPEQVPHGPRSRLTLALKKVVICVPLFLNAAVLIPVLLLMTLGGDRALDTYGEDTAANRILRCIYGAILVTSAVLLPLVALDNDPTTPPGRATSPAPPGAASYWAEALMAVQVVYKLATPFAVGTLENPVVISNICIAAAWIAFLATAAAVDRALWIHARTVRLADNAKEEAAVVVVDAEETTATATTTTTSNTA
jgi:hypothetical protein